MLRLLGRGGGCSEKEGGCGGGGFSADAEVFWEALGRLCDVD